MKCWEALDLLSND